MSGILVPLDQVPDPVFAQRMVGDGVSIDPTSSILVAPCAGRVAHLHGARHAITLTTADGLEVMIHVGLDTVRLQGRGFTAHVADGDEVHEGQTLLEFDADAVAQQARSLLTQLVITNGERVAHMTARSGTVTAGRDTVLEIQLRAAGDATGGVAAGHATGAAMPGDAAALTSEPVRIQNALGLHARPAAVLAASAKGFAADVSLVRASGGTANAKSVVAIMAMEVAQGDELRVRASGADAARALATLVPLLASGLGESASATPGDTTGVASARLASEARTAREATDVASPAFATAVDSGAVASARAHPGETDSLLGVAASPGVAVGHVFRIRHERIEVVEHGADPRAERRALDEAIVRARDQVRELARRLAARSDASKAAIFAAHEELLDDPEVVDVAAEAISAGKSAAWAWSHAVEAQVSRLAGLKNALLAARANDLRDVGRRVLRLLTGAAEVRLDAPANAILIAEDLTPSDTTNLDRTKVLGFCTTSGGATSHVAILARALDIPAIAAIDPRALDLADGTPVVLDGTAGVLRLRPSESEMAQVRERQQQHAARRQIEIANAAAPATTSDGRRIEVVANVGGAAETEQVVALGGEGVGLLRSEFLFLDRVTAPDEDEQTEAYTAIARQLGAERRLIIRTLDVGGDKPLAYLPMGHEDNPFLGERGIRVQLNRPELLRTQLRAILRASRAGNVHVMFPMVATLNEWRAAKAMLEDERETLGCAPIPAGIMVEVPSAAIMAEAFAGEVDFFSIGTNDLTQYTLAMDRGHPRLAPQIDGLNPAVLQLIAHTVAAAHARGKWVGVCGGIAGDAQAIPLLIGLGVDELSVSVPSLPGVKAQVRELSHAACVALATRALAADSAADVRALVAPR